MVENANIENNEYCLVSGAKLNPRSSAISKPIKNEPRQVVFQQQLEACRKGWPGAWDAIKAAWRKTDRLTSPRIITIRFYLSAPPNVDVVGEVTSISGEINEK